VAFSRLQYKKRTLALVIPAHNEEIVLADTIQSAIKAGQHPSDIFVVSDGSVDATVEIATRLLGSKNVVAQPQAGKARAILHAIQHFEIVRRYEWMHVADADGVFAETYFKEMVPRLNRKYIAATGYLRSLPGGLISQYRSYEYTLGLEVIRRFQAFFNVIPVIPGPTSVFRTDILKKLDFTTDSLTEDMDITMQIHRQKLGQILYIPQAQTFTQDPKDISDYIKQISRWYRGAWQVMFRHRVGMRLKPEPIDAYVGYVMLEQWITAAELIALPLYVWITRDYALAASIFLSDFVFFLTFTIWAAAKNKRDDVLAAFPVFYVLRGISLYIFLKSWFEIVVLRKFRAPQAGWSVAGRRYRIVTDAAR
jgi:biofilm PGA synthesis N-glycosyltransferase PgaC